MIILNRGSFDPEREHQHMNIDKLKKWGMTLAAAAAIIGLIVDIHSEWFPANSIESK